MREFPDMNWVDALSSGQIYSKQWVINILKDFIGESWNEIVICGSWLGILSAMIDDDETIHVNFCNNLDFDVKCINVGERLSEDYDNKQIHFMHIDMAAAEAEPFYITSDIIINTVTEHLDKSQLDKWFDMIPPGKFVLVQGNDFSELDEHVNTSKDLADFNSQFEFSNILYTDELQIEYVPYKRFMTLGVR